MATTYYAVITEQGNAKIANAILMGTKVNITEFAVGTGDGAYYAPTGQETALKDEKWRGNIQDYETDTLNTNVLKISAIVPSDVGGFTVREMGVFDDEGTLIAIANCPPMEKIVLGDGIVSEFVPTIKIAVSNTSVINFKVDPTAIIAIKADIKKAIDDLSGEELLAKMAADNSVLPVANGGTGANTAKGGLANLLGLSKLAAISAATNYADTSIDGVMFVSLSPTNHAGLYALLGELYAYIVQIFYVATDASRSRIQIAHGYINNKMATRYYNGNTGTWSSWQKVYTDADVIPVANGGTGATDSSTICKNIGALQRTSISPSTSEMLGETDLNNVKSCGFYRITSSNTNGPITSGNGHTLLVIPWDTNTYMQMYFYGGPTVYIRVSTGAWYQIITENNLATQVQSLLTGGSVSVIKSIQRGTVNLENEQYSATATISAVDTSKAVIHFLGGVYENNTLQSFGRIELTNSTTVSVYRYVRNYTAAIGFEVVEYY
ncbi:MAG: phage tail protein [Clostridia bacterium]|jgi:phage-related tail fiber protein|nr:phage tail protein [Clostridia bacterium]